HVGIKVLGIAAQLDDTSVIAIRLRRLVRAFIRGIRDVGERSDGTRARAIACKTDVRSGLQQRIVCYVEISGEFPREIDRREPHSPSWRAMTMRCTSFVPSPIS